MAGWPVPADASQIAPPGLQAADEVAWLNVRRGGLGGSDIAAVLGVSPFKSAYRVWLDKTGRLPRQPSTYLMERGHRFEAACAQWFSDESGLSTRRTGTWARDDEPWMLANPDRFTSDGGGYEGKIVGGDWGKLWEFGVAQHAAFQAVWSMAVTGLPHWYVAAAMDARFAWWRLDRDPDVEEQVVEACAVWWQVHIVDGVEPPVDGSADTADALKAAYAQPVPRWRAYTGPELLSDMAECPGLALLRDERRVVKAQIKAAEARLKQIDNTIHARLGHARVGLDHGLPVIGRKVRTRRVPGSDNIRTTYTQLEEYR